MSKWTAVFAPLRAMVAWLRRIFRSGYLSADGYGKFKPSFIQEWAARELGEALDSDQAAAVASLRNDVQVVARAGSGKTRTLVTRAIFLQKHCQVPSREILLLAFNKKAAEEMKSRLAEALGDDLPHVMTFHALANAIVQPEEQLVADDPSADQPGYSREIQEVIDEHVRSEEYGDSIRELMLAHFREDWERIVHGGFEMKMDEFLAHRRSLPRESLNGEYVKSLGEKIIANALFEHGVEYKYERNFKWDGVNYRPDFTIPQSGVIIEYFGMEGDPDYDAMSQRKREFWAGKGGWTLLEFTPKDIAANGESGFIRVMLEQLQELGIPCTRRTEEEIWELVRRRAIYKFTGAMKNFIGRCRKFDLSPEDLESMIAGHTACSTAEGIFLEVGGSVYRGYLERLTAEEKEDFDGLMWRSVYCVRNGQTRFVRDRGREQGDLARLKFVMIDEFQDFSRMFFALVEAIRSSNLDVQFFCVGDDWQAINGFAGSDLVFFDNFKRYFDYASSRHIRTNYRSTTSVVKLGNALMRRRGVEARPNRKEPGQVWVCKLDEFSPSAAEKARHDGDEIIPAILRLTRHFLDLGLDVVILARKNSVHWYRRAVTLEQFAEWVRSYLPEEDRERVSASTTHKYKGLEQSAVIVLDAVEDSYPLVHPHWVFLRVFGDSIASIEDEERRLFYVAATRAEESLALVTETGAESPYLSDIRKRVRLDSLAWDQLDPVVPPPDSARLEIRVFNAYRVKDQLKTLGYQWNGARKYWYGTAFEEGFSFDDLLNQPWAREGIEIEVYSETGELLHQSERLDAV